MKKLAPRVSMFALILALSSPAFIRAQPTIDSAQVFLSAQTIQISGKDFGTSEPMVKLDGGTLAVTYFDQTLILANLPPGPPSDASSFSYALSVTTEVGTAKMDVTIGTLNVGERGNGSTSAGYQALDSITTGSNNIAIGEFAGAKITTGDNNIDIGNLGAAAESNTIRIGGDISGSHQTRTFIAGIDGTAVDGLPVVVSYNDGQLGVQSSSERFKDDIKPMDAASEAILTLRPVTFRYKHEIDPNGIPQFGLVAEEVEKVNPNLVARDAQGKVFAVRYAAVNAMLLNEFLKEHRTVEELKGTIGNQEAIIENQEATITELKAGIEALTANLKKQEAQIQKVSAQLEMTKPAPRTVDNSQ